MLPAGQDAAEAFYRVVDAAYEKRGVAVTSNLHPAGFDSIMPKTLATATVDRLLHHAHVVLVEGSSHRLAEATAGKGLTPLTDKAVQIRRPRTRTRHGHPQGDQVPTNREPTWPPTGKSRCPLTAA